MYSQLFKRNQFTKRNHRTVKQAWPFAPDRREDVYKRQRWYALAAAKGLLLATRKRVFSKFPIVSCSPVLPSLNCFWMCSLNPFCILSCYIYRIFSTLEFPIPVWIFSLIIRLLFPFKDSMKLDINPLDRCV